MAFGNGDNGNPGANWAALSGRWIFSDGRAEYGQGTMPAVTLGQPFLLGIAISNLRLQDGKVSVTVRFKGLNDDPQGAGVVLGYRSTNERYIVAQLSGGKAAYTLSEFDSSFGFRPIAAAGLKENLVADREYRLEVYVTGQRIGVTVDEVGIFESLMQAPFSGSQIGLIASGDHPIAFTDIKVETQPGRVFVAMQFGEPFDTIYREVIQSEVQKLGLDIVHMGERAGPGIVFEDMQRQISEANVIVAEISAPNQNVFYELGYAHALNKPTILLAQRERELPFDIRSYRVIFYDDTIGGKAEVERNLGRHLRAVLQQS